jgi:hypothetical protein
MIEWSPGAEQQLFEIRLGFSTDAALERFEQTLDAALEQLETFPQSADVEPTRCSFPDGWGLPLDCVAG